MQLDCPVQSSYEYAKFKKETNRLVDPVAGAGVVLHEDDKPRFGTVDDDLDCQIIASVDSSVPMFMKILKNSRWFRPDGQLDSIAPEAIESNCPSGSKSSRIFQNFHEHRDGTVHTLDGTEYIRRL